MKELKELLDEFMVKLDERIKEYQKENPEAEKVIVENENK